MKLPVFSVVLRFFPVLVLLSFDVFPQVVFTNTEHDVYSFLERMSVKGFVQFHDEVRPLPRVEIAALLDVVARSRELLNPVDRESLDWFRSDFVAERDRLSEERWHLLKYRDTLLGVTFFPLAGYKVSSYGQESGHRRWWGLGLRGTYGNYFGANFEYRDNSEYGGTADRKKTLTPETGYFINAVAGSGFDYSDVRGSMSLNWSWGSVSLIKDYMKWGHGAFGQIILSGKAPSFPQVRLILKPKDWFRFYYFHGWLNSLVYDSAYFMYNQASSSTPTLRRKYVDKYIVANMLSVSPFDWLDASLGNSYIYGGDVRLEMLIPFNYYKVMDHNTGRQGLDDGNGMIFSDFLIKYPAEYRFYASFLIDALNIREMLKGQWWTSWFAFTVGAKKVDFVIPNLDLTLEYTRLNPWIYENRDEVSSYKHLNFVLGHWIGQNADEAAIRFSYRPRRDLHITLTAEQIRKGGLNDIAYAYSKRTEWTYLYAPLRRETAVSITARYEPFREVFVEGVYKFADISDEDQTRTPKYMLGSRHAYSFSLSYGM